MWECDECRCRGIAGDLGRCPQCGKEKIVPTITSGGASNAWEQQDPEPEVSFTEETTAAPDPALTGGPGPETIWPLQEAAGGEQPTSDEPASVDVPAVDAQAPRSSRRKA